MSILPVWPLHDLEGLSEPVAEQCGLLSVCGLDGRSIKRRPPLSYQLTAPASSAPEAALVGSAMLVTGVEGLYVWCRRITGGYRGVEVNNMTEAWRSGLAFCAIIHRFRPDLIDYDGLDESDPVGNCELAFRVAERELGIPALLDPRDMLDCPVIDKLSVLTYLAQFYHKFSGTAPQPTTRNSRVSSIASTNPSLSPRVSVSSPRLSVPTESTSPPHVEAASSDSSSSSSSDVSTDSGLDQSASEMSSPCSRVSSVSPVSSASPETPRVSPPEPPVGFRGILKSRDSSSSSKLGKKKEYSRSFESLLDIPSPAPKRSDSNSELRNDQTAESSFKAAFKKFSTLSCSSTSIKTSPSCSPPKPARSHLVVGRSASSSLLRTVECQTEERVPVLVSQVTQTEESHLEQGEERRRGRSHRRQTSTTVPRAHIVNAQHPRGVPNCDRNRQSRLLNGIASYGQLDRLLGRSMENIYSASPHPPPPSSSRQNRVPQFARTHSTLV